MTRTNDELEGDVDNLIRRINRLVWANRILAIAVAITFAIIVTSPTP